MTIEEELAGLSAKVDEYHRQEMVKSSQDKYSKLGFILWAFSFATMSFTVAIPTLGNVSMAIIFFIAGVVSLLYSARFKAK
ncbi:MAG: hypothetical protein HW402_920 [Dehalococcoidales bacterium]|nr:hypothetical protein [Dehalococcoidales bacterium]